MIHLRHFRYFIAVGEELNFHRAAERLHISQPALWRQIRDLEHELGVDLLERQPRGIKLTTAGAALLEEALKLQEQFEEATARVVRVARGQTGVLRIAFNEIAARNPMLPRYFRAFRARYPETELQLNVVMSQRQFAMFEENEIDAGFLFNRPLNDVRFGFRKISTDDHVLAIPKDHKLARARTIRLADLTDEPLIFPSRALNRVHHGRLTAACLNAGLNPNIVQHADNENTLLNMVSAGMGIAFVNASCLTKNFNEVVLKPIHGFSIPVQLDLVWRKDRTTPVLARFVDLVSEIQGQSSTANKLHKKSA